MTDKLRIDKKAAAAFFGRYDRLAHIKGTRVENFVLDGRGRCVSVILRGCIEISAEDGGPLRIAPMISLRVKQKS